MSIKNKLNTSVIVIIIVITLLFFLDLCTYSVLEDGFSRISFGSANLRNIDLKSFIQTLLSSLLGILLSLFVIEQLLNKTKDEEFSKHKELREKSLMRTLSFPIRQYHIAAISITNRNVESLNKVVLPMTMEALCDIFNDQFLGNKRLWMKKIEYYSEAVVDLRNAISNVVLNTDLTDNPELLELLCSYLEESPKYDTCSSLVDLMQRKIFIDGEEKQLSSIFTENLPKVGLEVDSSNECYKFVQLKNLVEYHDSFLKQLKQFN